MAVVVALMSMLLMSALSAALVLTTSAETAIASNFRLAEENLYAADAALEVAIAELATASDWTPVLDGSLQSGLARTPPEAGRLSEAGAPLDLDRLVNTLNCRNAGGCTAASLAAITAQRPWGANNPVWRLYTYAPLSTLLGDAGIESAAYVVVLVADDPSETDGDPLRDGNEQTNAGLGTIVVRGEAFGPRGTHQIVEATVTRPDAAADVRILAWRVPR